MRIDFFEMFFKYFFILVMKNTRVLEFENFRVFRFKFLLNDFFNLKRIFM